MEFFFFEKINKFVIDIFKGEFCVFKLYGLVLYLFIEMGVYCGSYCEFFIVGFVVKLVEMFYYLLYLCEWFFKGDLKVIKGKVYKIFLDWNYGKFYIVVVIICVFWEDVGVVKEGGELILYVGYGDEYR